MVGAASSPRVVTCELRNLSFAGMCFASQDDFQLNQDYSFRIQIRDLQDEHFTARAGIRWKRAVPDGGFEYGAVFRESSKGWLGPPS